MKSSCYGKHHNYIVYVLAIPSLQSISLSINRRYIIFFSFTSVDSVNLAPHAQMMHKIQEYVTFIQNVYWGLRKCPPSCRRHFQIDFFKPLYFDRNFTEVCLLVSNWQYASNGSGNGLAPPGNMPYLNQCWPRFRYNTDSKACMLWIQRSALITKKTPSHG